MTQTKQTSDEQGLKKACDEMDKSISSLSRAAIAFDRLGNFDGTVKEIKETIGDIVCSTQQIKDMEQVI